VRTSVGAQWDAEAGKLVEVGADIAFLLMKGRGSGAHTLVGYMIDTPSPYVKR
jgi:hypothetical protein